ncbi:tRNA (adenosine(37)-N6)-dimethylallyltransferase MiaA [Pollutibacter soli]|uniref:tRNA (adenosine(37)-N6)-dimethylallyltransferase MiaA n=1 Tax=Pollutibacter soli TaxID=3034157 RepID=UPI003013E5D0
MSTKTVIIIVGPTAVGKTSLSVSLAKHFNTEIISADSRQCFKELNIGVAKPTIEEQQNIPHHFISSHAINDFITAADFETYALEKLEEIFRSKDTAIVIGGTGLYIKALMYGFDNIPEVPQLVREDVQELYQHSGLEALKTALITEDPEYARTGEMLNPQRMMRALEVKRASGYSIRHFQQAFRTKRNFRMIELGLELPRETLYDKINRRVDEMIRSGLQQEVRDLYSSRNLNALQTVGYRELFDQMEGRLTIDEAINKIKQNTRHYAKRQMTWFKADPVITWFHPEELEKIIEFLDKEIGPPKNE